MTNRFCNVRFFATIGIAVKEAIEMLNPKWNGFEQSKGVLWQIGKVSRPF